MKDLVIPVEKVLKTTVLAHPRTSLCFLLKLLKVPCMPHTYLTEKSPTKSSACWQLFQSKEALHIDYRDLYNTMQATCTWTRKPRLQGIWVLHWQGWPFPIGQVSCHCTNYWDSVSRKKHLLAWVQVLSLPSESSPCSTSNILKIYSHSAASVVLLLKKKLGRFFFLLITLIF